MRTSASTSNNHNGGNVNAPSGLTKKVSMSSNGPSSVPGNVRKSFSHTQNNFSGSNQAKVNNNGNVSSKNNINNSNVVPPLPISNNNNVKGGSLSSRQGYVRGSQGPSQKLAQGKG